jgi:hypothetical protein
MRDILPGAEIRPIGIGSDTHNLAMRTNAMRLYLVRDELMERPLFITADSPERAALLWWDEWLDEMLQLPEGTYVLPVPSVGDAERVHPSEEAEADWVPRPADLTR